MHIQPSPGIALILPIEEKSLSGLNTGVQQKRILKGVICEMGADDTNNYGGTIKAADYGKENDTIYFLSYYQEGNYDSVKINGEKYYLVKFGDFRLNLGRANHD